MNTNDEPYIFDETAGFAVVFKPPKMHCAPAGNFTRMHEDHNTLLDWYTEISPPVFDIMHRLDYETHGLVLFAKNESSFNYFKSLQDKGEFIKEYSAVCTRADNHAKNDGFPPAPARLNNLPFTIESYFRPYGPGRKLVRPVIDDGKKHKETAKDKGGFYQTEIINIDSHVITARIKRGFRHQIRCHLCWTGFPILGDPLYSQEETISSGRLALRSHALFFADPENGKIKECRIPPLKNCLLITGKNCIL